MTTPYALFLEGAPSAVLHTLGETTVYRSTVSVNATDFLQAAYEAAMGYAMSPAETAAGRWYDTYIDDATCSYLGVPARLQRDLDCYMASVDRQSAPQFLKTMQGILAGLEGEGLVLSTSGKWALTSAGVVRAVALRPMFSVVNVSSFWIAMRVDKDYMTRLTSALSAKCPRSAHFNEILDLVNHYFGGITARDGFRKRISEGRPPAFSDIKQWVYNAALSLWRDEGRDAQTRAFKGSRTEKDLRQDNDDDVAERSLPTEAQGIFLVTDGEGDTGSMASSGSLPMPLVDVLGGNFEEEMLHRLSWERGIERATAVLRRAKPGSTEQVELAILAAQGERCSVRSGVVSNLHAVVLRERAMSSLALSVMEYLIENPYSTRADIEAPVNNAKDASEGGIGMAVPQALLDRLVEAGRIQCIRGSYLITGHGRVAVNSEDYFGMDPEIHRATRGQSISA